MCWTWVVKFRRVVIALLLLAVAFFGFLVWRLPVSSERLRAKVIKTLPIAWIAMSSSPL